MDKYKIRIKVDDAELCSILGRLSAAQEEILKCYNDLERLGVVEMQSAASGN